MNKNKLDEPYLIFSFNAGIIIRGQIIRELKSAAWGHGFDIEIEEDKGLFESVYRVKITNGTGDELFELSKSLEKWFDHLGNNK